MRKRDRIDARIYIAFVCAVAGITILGRTCDDGLHAQERDSTRIQRELSLAVAKVSVNEASLQEMRPAEVALIWQCAASRARTPESRLSWLRAHSSCVLTDRPLTERELESNCRWTRNLADSDAEPAGWPVMLEWEGRYQRRWGQVRIFAHRLVTGAVRMEPCPEPPFTWGGRRIDMRHALEHGLRPLNCRDPETREPTINEGFALVSRSPS